MTARDGLSNEDKNVVPTVRAELVDRIVATGVSRVEVASFVHPERVAAMAGAETVIIAPHRTDNVAYSGLVLNRRGYERFRESRLQEVHSAFAATDTFNRRNAGGRCGTPLTRQGRL